MVFDAHSHPALPAPLQERHEPDGIQTGAGRCAGCKIRRQYIDGKRGRLEYRGIAVEKLANESSLKKPPGCSSKENSPPRELADFDDQMRHHRRIQYKLIDLISACRNRSPHGALQSRVAARHVYPARDVTNAQSNWDSVVRLIAKLPTLVAAFDRLRHGDEAIHPRDDLDHAANFYYMLPARALALRPQGARRVPDPARRAHDERLDLQRPRHRLDLANPYTVISAAIGTLPARFTAAPTKKCSTCSMRSAARERPGLA